MSELYPALTPLTGAHPGGEAIAGVSLNVDAAVQTSKKGMRKAARTGFLFTHRGFSGPSVLDLSHHAVRALEGGGARPLLLVNWTADSAADWDARLSCKSAAAKPVVSVLRAHLPARLAHALCAEADLLTSNCSEIRKPARVALLDSLTRFKLPYDGHQG